MSAVSTSADAMPSGLHAEGLRQSSGAEKRTDPRHFRQQKTCSVSPRYLMARLCSPPCVRHQPEVGRQRRAQCRAQRRAQRRANRRGHETPRRFDAAAAASLSAGMRRCRCGSGEASAGADVKAAVDPAALKSGHPSREGLCCPFHRAIFSFNCRLTFKVL